MIVRAFAVFLGLAPAAHAQGFAGLGTDADGFAVPQRPAVFDFPRDHGAHPEYRIEWWYLTATLQGEDGQDYGVQWTLFRSAMAPEAGDGWQTPQLWMGHAGLTTAGAHYSAERLARGGIGQAGVIAAPFDAWIDNWHMTSTVTGSADQLSALDLHATGDGFSYDLALTAEGPLVFQGDAGYSVKSAEGQASYYYSQPFYSVDGSLLIEGEEVAVTGTAWLDREWSSQPLSETQDGWDWFSLQFEDGSRMMGFQLRDRAGDAFTASTWFEADGTTTTYANGDLRITPLVITDVDGREVPTEWRLELPLRGIDITTAPLNPNSWMDVSVSYWEGPIRFSGSHAGIGYLEMTGYE